MAMVTASEMVVVSVSTAESTSWGVWSKGCSGMFSVMCWEKVSQLALEKSFL